MLPPHAGRPGVQSWDQGSLITFALTGAVQPSTCCTVEFPPLGCTARKLLPTNGSSLVFFFFPLRALDWEERGGGNMPNQDGIIQPHRLQKKLHLPFPARVWMKGVRKAGEPAPVFFSHSTTGPAKPTKPWRGVWQRRGGCTVGFNQFVLVDGVRAPHTKVQVMPLHGDFP